MMIISIVILGKLRRLRQRNRANKNNRQDSAKLHSWARTSSSCCEFLHNCEGLLVPESEKKTTQRYFLLSVLRWKMARYLHHKKLHANYIYLHAILVFKLWTTCKRESLSTNFSWNVSNYSWYIALSGKTVLIEMKHNFAPNMLRSKIKHLRSPISLHRVYHDCACLPCQH